MKKTVWEKTDEKGFEKIMSFADEYRKFMNVSKTERTFVTNSVKIAEENGFKKLKDCKDLKPGDRVYCVNRHKNFVAFIIGKKDLREGMNILGGHIDSPRLDIKSIPLYEKDGLVLLDTHYYGGIKKYLWVTRQLALVGVVCKKDGTTVDVNIGEDDNDPIFTVTDLLIHLSGASMGTPANKVVEGEKLDLLAGSIPAKDTEKDPVKTNILKLLKEKYDIEEDDFLSAELEVVPADKMRDLGFDRSMLAGYGHDDKVCSYTSLRAMTDLDVIPEKTSCVILVDKEEIGSVGNTGMESRYFDDQVIRLLHLQGHDLPIDVADTYANTKMLSSDVGIAIDPNYESVMDPKNSAYLGKGICFEKFTGSRGKSGASDANAEFLAKVRKVMDDNDCAFQFCELGAVDAGGGGTIGYVLANKNIDVLDAGIPVLSMHSTCEVVSKADVYEAYRAYMAFLKDMD